MTTTGCAWKWCGRVLEVNETTQSCSFFRMCFARFSLISVCRGTGCDMPVRGLRNQSCLPPCRTNWHPVSCKRVTSSRRFKGESVRQPGGRLECLRSSDRGTDPSDDLAGPRDFLPAFDNPDIPRNIRANGCHHASKRNALSPCYQYSSHLLAESRPFL
jgi:hypothetical protein